MKASYWFILPILVIFLFFGCGEKSSIEGKVVDGNGQPISKVKIIAKQVQPLKGYEYFETTTGSDGTFRLSKLFPASEYVLFPWAEGWGTEPMMVLKYESKNLRALLNKEGWATESKMIVQSGPEGQTLLLPSPLMVLPAVSTVEGKVVDVKGQPIANIRIIAKQIKPVPGYEQFETTIDSEGIFRFTKLFPNSQYYFYYFFLSAEDWEHSGVTVQSGQEEEHRVIEAPLVVRFTPSKAGVVADSVTGLEWFAGPDRDTTWHEAKAWVESLNVAGGGWRMPTMEELKTLYQKGAGTHNMTALLKINGWWVWSGETKDSSSAWSLSFVYGPDFWNFRYYSINFRGIAVRSRTQ